MLGFAVAQAPREPRPPRARQIPHRLEKHGDVRIDPFYWLREQDNPEVRAYLEAENAYTEAVMAHTRPLQEALFKEMRARIKETDLSVPERLGDYYYYTRTEAGKQYPIYCRKKGSLDAPEEILLDQNQLAEGHSFCRIGAFRVSPDQRLLAFSVDYNGSEQFLLQVKNLETGEMLPDRVAGTYYSVEWANDNRTLFYSTLDETMRPYRLYRHRLGQPAEQDQLVFEEPDEAYYLYLNRSRDDRFLFLTLESNTTTEVHFLPADQPKGRFRLVEARRPNVEYSLASRGDYFYILTNDQARNFRVMRTPINRPGRENWEEVIPHRPQVKVDRMELFANHMVLLEREQGLKKIRIQQMDSGQVHYVKFPEPAYNIWPARNPEFNTNLFRFTYTSLVTPRSVYDYHMDTRQMELKKRDDVLGGYNPENYVTERLWAPARDGKKVPISLVYRKGLKKDGSHPLYLYGYGAYGISIDPGFSASRVSLLDRGFVFAIAHIRGGGALGREWYEEGKLLKKKNTFFDFIDCAEFLIREGYTRPERLVISGGSAGGLLMGAVTNMRPDLFRLVIAKVPFVDVLTTMLDPDLPLTVTEYEEWGNPNIPEYYWYIKSYSPYDNVTARDYPNMLITAGWNDPRVKYWEPAKWAAKLRALKTDHNRLLLKTNMGAGHGGASGRYDYLKEIAFEYAFILDVLGLTEDGGSH
ncbi:MAG: S9 family peptidase [Calditrichaeota bacterium]|nr:MAG: S9 family peptidase [Calditrichota bacterium]